MKVRTGAHLLHRTKKCLEEGSKLLKHSHEPHHTEHPNKSNNRQVVRALTLQCNQLLDTPLVPSPSLPSLSRPVPAFSYNSDTTSTVWYTDHEQGLEHPKLPDGGDHSMVHRCGTLILVLWAALVQMHSVVVSFNS